MRIVIHRLTVVPSGYPDTLDGVMHFFLERHGWRDVYHFLIWPDRVEQWCPLDKRGAHAAPFNTGSWGLAAIGDWRTQEPSVEQWGLAVDLAARLHWSESTWPWTTLYRNRQPHYRLSGHGELPGISKDCPGAGWPMDRFRRDVTAGVVELHREMGMVSPGERRRVLGWG